MSNFYEPIRLEDCAPNVVALARAKSAVQNLRKALTDLVEVNEAWNSAVQAIIKKPPGWNDSYLDAARLVLEQTKEFAG